MLRNRLVGTALTMTVVEMGFYNAQRRDDGTVEVTFRVLFTIKNEGRIAAYKWQFIFDTFLRRPVRKL